MGTVDLYSYKLSKKILVVSFLAGIIAGSIFLLIKLLRCPSRDSMIFSVRRCMMVCLALGSLFYAGFTLVVSTQLIYSDDDKLQDLSCTTILTAQFYGLYFFPFVYAGGLILLWFELVSSSIKTLFKTKMLTTIYALIPWGVGLVVILPLTMSGVLMDGKCFWENLTQYRLKAEVVVSTLLPSLAVLIVAIFSKIKINMLQPAQSFPHPIGGAVISPGAHQEQQLQVTSVSNEHTDTKYVQATQSVPEGENKSPIYQDQSYQPVQNPQIFTQPVNQALFNTNYYVQPVTTDGGRNRIDGFNDRDIHREAKVLLIASICFFFAIFPSSVYTLTFGFKEIVLPTDSGEVALYSFFNWLPNLGWMVLCVIWCELF